MIGSQLADIQWWEILERLWHMLGAYILAIPIGLDREKSRRQFGVGSLKIAASSP
jgi:hypothetical protein